MKQDLLDDGGVFDETDAHDGSASAADERVHFVNLLEETGPVAAALFAEFVVLLWWLRRGLEPLCGGAGAFLLCLAHVRIVPIIPQQLLSLVGDMSDDGGKPIQGGRDCRGVGSAVPIAGLLCGIVGDRAGSGIVVQPFHGKGGMQEIAYEPLPRGGIARFDRLTPEKAESRVLPAEQEIDDTGGDYLLAEQCLKELVTEETHHLFRIEPRDGMEATVVGEAAVRCQTVQMGWKRTGSRPNLN